MENIEMAVKDNMLTIKVKLDAPGSRSASGKSTVIASTRGNAKVPGTDVVLGLNVYRKA